MAFSKQVTSKKRYEVKVAIGDEPEDVLLRVEGRLAYITLNRPERLNAISEVRSALSIPHFFFPLSNQFFPHLPQTSSLPTPTPSFFFWVFL
jgi:hypothetical protein